MAPQRPIPSMVVLGLLAAGCGGDGPTYPNGDGEDRELHTEPSFAENINEIFQRRGCTASQCHGGGQMGLELGASAAANYDELVGVPSQSEPDFDRVEPGDATNSYLVIKLEGRQSVGEQMPLGMTPLDEVDIGNIKNWINNGAPNN